jgi:transcriptional regulator with XRE-family HTH domain
MRLDGLLSDETVLGEVGARLERIRLQRNTSQADLARSAGISRRSLQRLEAGEDVQLTTLLRTLRALELLQGLDAAVPEPLPSPLEEVARAGRPRRRARHRAGPPPAPPSGGWRWGDEPGGAAGEDPGGR